MAARQAKSGRYRGTVLYHHSKSVATLISNAQKLVGNCIARSDLLAPHGWSPAETQLLAAAIETLKQADTDHETASDLKEGYVGHPNGSRPAGEDIARTRRRHPGVH